MMNTTILTVVDSAQNAQKPLSTIFGSFHSLPFFSFSTHGCPHEPVSVPPLSIGANFLVSDVFRLPCPVTLCSEV